MGEHFYTYPTVIELRREEPGPGSSDAVANRSQPSAAERVSALGAEPPRWAPEPAVR